MSDILKQAHEPRAAASCGRFSKEFCKLILDSAPAIIKEKLWVLKNSNDSQFLKGRKFPFMAQVEVEKLYGIRWDVMTPRSESLEGKRIFNIEKIIASLKIAYDKDENLIIHITNLHEDDLKIFYKEFKKNLAKKNSLKLLLCALMVFQ